MFWKEKNEKLDTARLNEVIRISHHLLKVLFVLICLGLIVLGTYLMKSWNILTFLKTILIVISPVFIGLVIAWLFDPVVSFLKQKGVPRVVGTLIVYVIFLSLIYLLLSLMIPTLSDQINDFVSSIPSILNYLKDFISDFLDKLSRTSSYDFQAVKQQIFKAMETFGLSLTTKLPALLMNLIKSIFNGGITLVLGFMLGFYMLIDFPNVGKHLLEVLPSKWHKDAKELADRLNRSLKGFVQGTLFIMFLVFIAQSIGLTLAGLKAPLLFGIFCAVTNVIPYLGPYIGGVPAVIVGFSISPLTGIFTLISIVVVQMIESSFLQPIVMGKAMKLHPVTIMIGLLIFQYFFGIVGMIVATPVISSIKIIFKFIDEKCNFTKMIHHEEEIKKTTVTL